MMGTARPRSKLSYFLEDLQLEGSSGVLDIEDGCARLYFSRGQPVHAVCIDHNDPSGLLEGMDALDAIIAQYGNASRATFNPGAVPSHSLECSVEDLQHRLAAVERAAGDAGSYRSPSHGPPGGNRPALGDPAYKPLLPRGNALFDAIPLGALVIEALAPTVRDGAILITRPGTLGVVLVRNGELSEVFLFDGEDRSLGDAALRTIRGLADANVSAYALDGELVDCAPALLRGDALYRDLHLSWIDWRQFVAEVVTRPGTHVLEVDTPRGRGVAFVRDGVQIGSYTETHRELGDIALLDELVADRQGSVWVREQPEPLLEPTAGDGVVWDQEAVTDRPDTSPAPDTTARPAEIIATPARPVSPPAPAPMSSPPPDAPATTEAVLVPVDEPSGMPWEDASFTPDLPAGLAQADAESDVKERPPPMQPARPAPSPYGGPAPGSPTTGSLESAFSDIFSAGADDLTVPAWPPTADSGLPVWPPPAGSPPPPVNGEHDQLESTMGQLLPSFKEIARARLQRSAARVETMLDDAAQQGRPVEAILAEIRGLTIRGVMQSTLDQVVDEMMAVALEHHQ